MLTSKRVIVVLAILYLFITLVQLYVIMHPATRIVGFFGTNTTGRVDICYNNAPAMVNPGFRTARIGTLFTLQINASDTNANSVLSYSDNTSIFNINNETGLINFTPVQADNGTHSINITVTDDGGCGFDTNSTIFTLEVEFPPVEPAPGGAGGGGGGTGKKCTDECKPQENICISDTMLKACLWENGCWRYREKMCPVKTACVVDACVCREDWACNDWQYKGNFVEERECYDVNNCGTHYFAPVARRSTASCFDNKQNQGEEGIDCGGPCEPCIAGRRAPLLEKPGFAERAGYNGLWLLALLIAALSYFTYRHWQQLNQHKHRKRRR